MLDKVGSVSVMLMMTASALIIPQSEISLKTPAVPQDQIESGFGRHRVPKVVQVPAVSRPLARPQGQLRPLVLVMETQPGQIRHQTQHGSRMTYQYPNSPFFVDDDEVEVEGGMERLPRSAMVARDNNMDDYYKEWIMENLG